MSKKKNKDPRADDFIERQTQYKSALKRLRSILLDFDLEETVKWGKPCYMHGGANVAVLQVFKDYASVLFTPGRAPQGPGR